MAGSAVILALLCCIQLAFGHGDHDHEATEAPHPKTDLNVNIPNFLNMLPDFDKFFGDFNLGSNANDHMNRRTSEPDTPIRKHLKNVRENYQKIRKAVQGALNLEEGSDLFNLELRNRGPKTQLSINGPLGQLSLDAKSKTHPKGDIGSEELEDAEEIPEARSRRPFNEIVSDLIRDQSNKFDEFNLNILGPRSQDGEARNILSLSNKNDKTSFNMRSPMIPVSVSIASQDGAFSSRSGHQAPVSEQLHGDSGADEGWDPEDEYNQHQNHQKQKYFQMRSHGSGNPGSHSAMHSGSSHQSMTAKRMPYYGSHRRPHHYPYDYYDDAQGMGMYPGVHVHHHGHPRVTPLYDAHYFAHRTGHHVVAKGQQSPIENLPIQNYQDHRFMSPSFDEAAQEIVQSELMEDEQENYEDYIKDLEEATSSLGEEMKERLRTAFKDFKTSIEDESKAGAEIEAERKVDIDWLPRRVVEQHDLELAFLNIDKDSKERPNPNDRVVVAFTPTGEPLKIYVDSTVDDPVKYLQQILSDAGVTLNIPVFSYDRMVPVTEVLYVGAGNKGNDVSQAVALEVKKVDDIKKSVSKFIVHNRTESSASQVLAEALHDALSSGSLKFSEALEDNFQRNPIQVLADITTYLDDSPLPENEESTEETQEG